MSANPRLEASGFGRDLAGRQAYMQGTAGVVSTLRTHSSLGDVQNIAQSICRSIQGWK